MQEVLGKIGFDWQVALANLVNFFLVFFVLRKFFFKPIKKTIQDRKAEIAKGIKNAEQAEEVLASAESEKEGILKTALNESKQIVTEAKSKADETIKLSKVEAEVEKSKILDKASEEAKKLASANMDSFKKEATSLYMNNLEKILKSSFDKNNAEKLIKENI